MTVYKFLNGREATHVPGFRYHLRAWKPAIEGPLWPCRNAYHGLRVQDLPTWIARDLFVIESREEWLEDGNKLYTRGPVRIVEHLKGWNERTARLAAADFAEAVLPNFEKMHPSDDRPRKATQAARDYANGLVDEEARSAAYSAAYSAARSAARSAAYSAAYSAARWAAYSAARWAAYWAAYSAADWAAYSAADWAAYSAARWAADSAQGEIILDYAYGRRG